MNIVEATKKAIEAGLEIRRTSWPQRLSIKPTDTIDNCICHGAEKGPRRGWQPKARDLIATDWEALEQKGGNQ